MQNGCTCEAHAALNLNLVAQQAEQPRAHEACREMIGVVLDTKVVVCALLNEEGLEGAVFDRISGRSPPAILGSRSVFSENVTDRSKCFRHNVI